MIHIKVIRASHLAVALAVAAVVIGALILLGLVTRQDSAAKAALWESGGGYISVAAWPYWAEGEAAPAPRGQRVLIYHTHTHEAYAQVAEDPYVEVSAWRTADPDHSVVRVGESLAQLLRDIGYEVIHDATDHEGSDLSTAYERSLATLLSYDQPFDLYLDLHRDAYSGDGSPDSLAYEKDGTRYARVMILLGTGENFADKPDYAANLSFARAVTGAMSRLLPGAIRPVMTKKNRYNQHVGSPAILVEVGHNENTLQEALNALPALAQALDEALQALAE